MKHNAAIFVGDVASCMLVKTKMAKSTLDAGWAMLRAMLEYKSHQAGVAFEVVNESYSTQTCSCCAAVPASSPKGAAGEVEQVCE
ncbi:putative transposase DNA-binding domain protein [compost metagenome]